MSRDFLGERRVALEGAFFDQQSHELIRRMRASDPDRPESEKLAEVSGLHDEALLDRLVGLGIKSSTFAALSLVPLVIVAWADGVVTDKGRAAILGAAADAGLRPAGPGHELLSRWLVQPPPPSLMATWTDYVRALSPEARAVLRRQVMDRATKVAEAAGGMLGLLNGLSPLEKATLNRLEAALSS
ncbi:hypothetical protein [Roseomonas xinghualingensis]|uniref:hypothetical protein n=1 Tax=Roseomonas xinghualingensis TaxID=2986475 RepID=UPI0021F23895|nr:hypothetical protein [Roseomonas sp. SXEYE001]MCV4206778.1 hypothetical protein [Roseomonas sp. SXEYE001]